MNRDRRIFWSSVFFVVGFASVFSVVGILLQTALANVSAEATIWLGRAGGIVIILFGLYLLQLIRIPLLDREHKFSVKRRVGPYYVSSFIFGAAFALGWTPCVSAALGAILALATVKAGSALLLLFAYTLGIGLPFLLVGLFTSQAQNLIRRAGPSLRYLQYLFGALLILLGVLVFTGELSRVANFEPIVLLLLKLNLVTDIGGGINVLNLVTLGIAFAAGLGSFLSPCILPLLPAFLSYLSTAVEPKNEQ